MSNQKTNNEENRGYQPSVNVEIFGYQPSGTKVNEGYQPATSQGQNQSSPPAGSNAEDA